MIKLSVMIAFSKIYNAKKYLVPGIVFVLDVKPFVTCTKSETSLTCTKSKTVVWCILVMLSLSKQKLANLKSQEPSAELETICVHFIILLGKNFLLLIAHTSVFIV